MKSSGCYILTEDIVFNLSDLAGFYLTESKKETQKS